MVKILIALGIIIIVFFYLCFIRSVGRLNQKYDELVYEKFSREDVQIDEQCEKNSLTTIPGQT